MGLSYRKVWTFIVSVVYNIIHGIYVTIETTGKGKQLMTYQYIDDELDNRQHRHKQPLPRRDILREARKQAIAEARQTRQPPTQQRPQSIPHQSIADDLGYGDDEDWELARMPTVTRRYDLKPSYEEYYHPQPLRRSTVAPPQPQRRQVHPHWLLYVGVALFLVLMGYIGLTDFSNWWQGHQDDSTYGMPRTYQTDAVVGHNGDSSAHPSHFQAENLKGEIIVIEFPAGDITKARSYRITTIPGNDATVPAKVVFQDTRNSGKLDMVVIIGDPGSQVTITLYNDGTQFTGKQP